MNGDVCGDFPLRELYEFHQERSSTALLCVMSTEATRPQSLNFGCMVIDKNKNEVTHYVEKPSSYVSTLINCGVYVFSPKIFTMIGEQFNAKQEEYYKSDNGNASKDSGYLQIEQDILTPLAGTGKMFALPILNWWSQLKTASSAIYANRHYLELYRTKHPERLATGKRADQCTIIPDVHIDPSAIIHPTAVIGPNVSIGPGVNIGAGVRIRESIILDAAVIEERSLILHSIIGRNSRVGKWARVEGTPSDPDPNKPFAKMENPRLFNNDGRLNPSITILGCSVSVPSETILLNSIVLPNKELSRSIKNEIIL